MRATRSVRTAWHRAPAGRRRSSHTTSSGRSCRPLDDLGGEVLVADEAAARHVGDRCRADAVVDDDHADLIVPASPELVQIPELPGAVRVHHAAQTRHEQLANAPPPISASAVRGLLVCASARRGRGTAPVALVSCFDQEHSSGRQSARAASAPVRSVERRPPRRLSPCSASARLSSSAPSRAGLGGPSRRYADLRMRARASSCLRSSQRAARAARWASPSTPAPQGACVGRGSWRRGGGALSCWPARGVGARRRASDVGDNHCHAAHLPSDVVVS